MLPPFCLLLLHPGLVHTQKLCKARHILSRIRRRDLYKCVDQYVYPSSLVSTWDRTLLSETQVAAFLPLPCPDPSMSSPDDDPSAVVATTTTATTMKERGKEGGQGGKNVHESDIIVSWTNIHFGMKQQNPLQFVAFYSYRNLHESFLAVSLLPFPSPPLSFSFSFLFSFWMERGIGLSSG